MASIDNSPVELLKTILSNLNTPQLLNDHPWAGNAGDQLVETTLAAFRRMILPLRLKWNFFPVNSAQAPP